MTERQMKTSLNDIRADHLERYEYARDICSGSILDAACGVGYGSYLMSDQPRIVSIDSLDLSEEALAIANKHWKTPKVTFHNTNILEFSFTKKYDWLVSFETIEHVPNIEQFLTNASKHCKNLLGSVPNENVIPFSTKAFPFHLRHYKPEEFKQLLESCGWSPHYTKFQKDKGRNGLNFKTGRTIIIEATSNNYEE